MVNVRGTVNGVRSTVTSVVNQARSTVTSVVDPLPTAAQTPRCTPATGPHSVIGTLTSYHV